MIRGKKTSIDELIEMKKKSRFERRIEQVARIVLAVVFIYYFASTAPDIAQCAQVYQQVNNNDFCAACMTTNEMRGMPQHEGFLFSIPLNITELNSTNNKILNITTIN